MVSMNATKKIIAYDNINLIYKIFIPPASDLAMLMAIFLSLTNFRKLENSN